MNYFEAAAANLTFIQEICCKHSMAAKSESHPRNKVDRVFFFFFISRTNELVYPLMDFYRM